MGISLCLCNHWSMFPTEIVTFVTSSNRDPSYTYENLDLRLTALKTRMIKMVFIPWYDAKKGRRTEGILRNVYRFALKEHIVSLLSKYRVDTTKKQVWVIRLNLHLDIQPFLNRSSFGAQINLCIRFRVQEGV